MLEEKVWTVNTALSFLEGKAEGDSVIDVENGREIEYELLTIFPSRDGETVSFQATIRDNGPINEGGE